MKVDYQINKVVGMETTYHLDRIEIDKAVIMAQTIFKGTEQQCLNKLTEIKNVAVE